MRVESAEDRQITWVRSERTNNLQVIALLRKLVDEHPQPKLTQLILDNCKIHHSKITQSAVPGLDGRVKLHFLPMYCPARKRYSQPSVWRNAEADEQRL